ncbi:hypothetical protein IJ556_02750 [bacterium]|nr:hypothetical protein [bacterium]
MAKSQLIKDLARGEISVSDAFYRLLVIAGDLDNKTLINWACNEINGYPDDSDIPAYRVIESINIKYNGLVGNYKFTNTPLNPLFLGKENLEKIRKTMVKDGLKRIEVLSLSDNSLSIDLSFLAGEVFKNSKGLQCYSITQIIDSSLYLNILGAIKSKLILVLQNLEKEFGDIDELDVGTGDKTEQEIKQFSINIEHLIYENNSVSIGNENNISKAGIEAGKNE